MFSGHQRPAPRHLAGPSHLASAPAVEVALVADDAEVAPIARVHRSRLAFAVAVTVAALPVLVLDNLPATAETSRDRVDVEASRSSSSAWEPFTLVTPAPSTASTAAPATTAASETTSTEAPSTTGEEDDAVVQAMRAPAPPPPTTAPPTTAAPSPSTSGGADPNDPATWDRLAQCESSSNWSMNTGNGYYGGLQFSLATWRDVGGSGYPHQATRAEQIERGKILQARAGWDQWPICAKRLGYY
jgi:hypothetical protein